MFLRTKITLFCLFWASMAAATHVLNGLDPQEVPSIKRTPLELYLSSDEAYAAVVENPDILFIDVRDPLEVRLTGHPHRVNANVPVRRHGSEFDEEILEYAMEDNPDFIAEMDAALTHFGKSKSDLIIITCGSGWRSAVAIRKLAEAGYTNAWHIIDGYKGEEKRGRNSRNAWFEAGLPWSFTRLQQFEPR